MKRNVACLALLLAFSVALVACGGNDGGTDATTGASGDDDSNPSGFTLASSAFDDGGDIPQIQVCTNQGGQNLSPQLSWANAPDGATGFAVTCIDLDGPEGIVIHWALLNLPADQTGLAQGITNGDLPAGAWHALSYRENRRYDGPCPPSRHLYEFTVHALNAPLDDPGGDVELADIQAELDSQTIATAKLSGYFPPE